MPKTKATPLAKILGLAIIAGVVFFGFKYLQNSGVMSKIVPTSSQGKSTTAVKVGGKKVTPLRVCTNTWIGFAPGVYFNGGLPATAESRFTTEFGVPVELTINDDFQSSLDAWKADKVDLICNTADVLPVIFPNIMPLEPRVVFQIDWSRGGDVVVAVSSIKTVADLKGKHVAVAFGTPSQTLLLWVLAAGGLHYSDVQVVKAPTAIDAATYFKDGKVDAAVMWSPDDEDCVAKVAGAHVLRSTREASNAIGDIFYAKASFIQSHQKELKALVEGWTKAAAEINNSPEAKAQATALMAKCYNVPEAVMNLNNARFCTYGDNVNFFNMGGTYSGIKGEDLYEKTTSEIPQIALVFKESLPDQSTVPSWRSVVDLSVLKSLSNLESVSGQEAETSAKFSPVTKAIAASPAFSTKRVTINFATGVYELCDDCRYKIEKEFGDIAKSFANNRIRIEGNTDNVGSAQSNKTLSEKRAKAVANFLVTRYSFDPNRFVIVGNGPDKPVADNSTEDGRAQNRRTDFELIAE